MSYPYSAFAVDLSKLAAIAASANKRVESAMTKKFADRFAHNSEWFSDEIADGAPTLENALLQIIGGTAPRRSKHGFQYGYALELLVQHVGTRIDEDELGLGAGDCLEPFLKRAKRPKFDKLTMHGVLPIPIPKPANFPEISTMKPNNITAVVAALDAITPLIDDEGITEVATALRSWCTKATKKKASLVLFAY